MHLILRDGDKILLSQRGGPYGYGQWHAPSGKLDPSEPLTVATAREAYEETGVIVDPEHIRLVHTVHHHQAAAPATASASSSKPPNGRTTR